MLIPEILYEIIEKHKMPKIFFSTNRTENLACLYTLTKYQAHINLTNQWVDTSTQSWRVLYAYVTCIRAFNGTPFTHPQLKWAHITLYITL